MNNTKVLNYISKVVENCPSDWLKLTTHRLDIYNESLAKKEFLDRFEALYLKDSAENEELSNLPTAYDYIRLGHPLSSVLEWALAKELGVHPDQVITFSSKTTPILAVLRKNLLAQKNTQIVYSQKLPECFDEALIKSVYGYKFSTQKVSSIDEVELFDGSTIFVAQTDDVFTYQHNPAVDFYLNVHEDWGSVLVVSDANQNYVSAIQHVRRRETIAMTPANCFAALSKLVGKPIVNKTKAEYITNKKIVLDTIKGITYTKKEALLASSGLSIQYAIMMGLIDDALTNYPDKEIKIIVPPNCYGGTNDQARRVAACLDNVEVLDLPVDGDHDMVQSTEMVLEAVAAADAVPLIIAEIPTNPRVEVPDLKALTNALSKPRKTSSGKTAIDPVFILDQTFCPNVVFLAEDSEFSRIRTISYLSGSKFPSGGKCTAGYCVANNKAEGLMEKIDAQLKVCDNEATPLQVAVLAEQLPSMLNRIEGAYNNTRLFVNFIQEVLPESKINFVSEELAEQGFTPSVFSLDLPTKGDTHEEREANKRALNLKLINKMIGEIPSESKYCVSYGQLKGCYWTIPATSTQGTTKEGDKDYIVRVSVSPDLDLEKHKEVFANFVKEEIRKKESFNVN